MATASQPPRPPVPPQPHRTSGHLVAVALLVLALIIVVSALSVWTGLHFLSRSVRVRVAESGSGRKEVSIRTPVGSLEVTKEVNEARLGLPIYPGARRVGDNDGATLNMEFGGEEGVRLVVGKFETTDPIDKVRAFYEERVASQVTKFTEKDSEGKTVFEIKRGGSEKIVALKITDKGTRIELVRVDKGHGETN